MRVGRSRRTLVRQAPKACPSVGQVHGRSILQERKAGASMRIGMIGLGRMGSNMVRRLLKGGHECVAYDRSAEAVRALAADGARGAFSFVELVNALPPPRALWIMVPAAIVDAVIAELRPLLTRGDILIDGGNSHYPEDIRRADELRSAGIHYLDVGTSGGVLGLEEGYCLMIGGEPEAFTKLEPIFATLSPGGRMPEAPATRGATAPMGYLHCGPHGAGHFVKMVHNGIEYGLMAAYAEGLNLLAHADAGLEQAAVDAETAPLSDPRLFQYQLDVGAIAEVWRHGSIISSRLLDISAAAPDVEIGAGGGVRDRADIEALRSCGVRCVLIASALHDGRLTRVRLTAFIRRG